MSLVSGGCFALGHKWLMGYDGRVGCTRCGELQNPNEPMTRSIEDQVWDAFAVLERLASPEILRQMYADLIAEHESEDEQYVLGQPKLRVVS